MATKKEETPMLDPVAYRSDYNPNNIKEEYRGDPNIPGVGPQNANLNYNAYGDDSNPAQQGQKGGLNPKYEGEGVSNTYIEYDPNLRTSDLDPNYLYGENARQQNRQEAGYIARRNDNIASALYNEGLTSRADVENYLSQQGGWNDSTLDDRLNTIDSIWKRMGQIKPEEEREKPDLSKADEIVKDTSGKIYGKTTADEGNPEAGIDTLSDANSIYRMMEERRMSEVKDLLSMGTDNIAAALYGGELAEGSQSMRDYQTTYPELWNEVQTKLKQIRGQGVVDAITSGGTVPTNTNGTSGANNEIADFAANNAGYSESMSDILKDIHQTVSSSSSAASANQTMADIEDEMATLTNRLQNLRKEANSVFKGDVPDYIVNAYINNRSQEIQNKLQTLSERYKYASARYDKEVANAQWEKEYSLKERQVKIQEEELALKDWQIRNGITSTQDINNNSTTNSGDKYQVTTMTNDEVGAAVDELVRMFDYGQLGNAQCGVGLQRYYFPMLGISISGISNYEDKLALINEGEDYVPKKGDLIILSSKSKPGNGHIGVVIGVDGSGNIEYMDWNGSIGADGNGTEKAAISSININDSKIQGFRNINKNQTSNAYGWTDTDYANFEKLLDANTDKTDVEAIALKYGYKNNVPALTQIAREAISQRGPTETPIIGENSTWVDYIGLTEEQLAEVEKQIGYNPNIEWELQRLIENGLPTSGPAMQNVLKTTRAKDEEQLGQWLDHYQNKVNAEAATAGEDILLLLAQLQNLYRDADREDKVTKDGKTKTVFDTNAWQGWGNGTIGIKYEQLIKQLLLNKVTEARKKGATFGQMTEYEWRILEDAASALKIKFGPKSSDEGFSEAFFDLVNATWKLTHDSKSGPTATQWENYLNQIKNESEWYMTSGGQDLGIIDGSNLGGSQGTYNIENNDSTMGVLFGTGS